MTGSIFQCPAQRLGSPTRSNWIILIGAGFFFLFIQASHGEEAKKNIVEEQHRNTIEEITVTATKKESSAEDTPITMSIFDVDRLFEEGVNNALDVQFSTPNVLNTTTNFGTSNFTIRGVGNNATAGSADAGTGVHFNHMYLNYSHFAQMDFFDVERVEILRGPQGTLYGRNTTAGTINLITRPAEPEWGGYIDTQIGNYNEQKFNAAINFPITKNLFQRFAFFSHQRDGMTDNIATGNDIDGRDSHAIRSSTLYEINDTTDVSLVLNWFEEDSSRARLGKQMCTKDPAGILGCLPGSLGFETPHGAATIDAELSGLIGLLDSSGGQVEDQYQGSVNPADMRTVNLDFDPINKIDDLIAILEFNHERNNITYTTAIGHQKFEELSHADYDQTVANLSYNENPLLPPIVFSSLAPAHAGEVVDRAYMIDETFNEAAQTSIEIRATSNLVGPWNYTAGIYGLDFEGSGGYYIYSSSLSYYGQLIGLDERESLLLSDTKSYAVATWAGFGETYYDFNDKTRITVGIRYTDETKEQLSRAIFANFADRLHTPYRKQTYNATEITGKISIDYAWDPHFTDQALLYGILSRGYKGGGFNPGQVVGAGVSNTFDPEFNNAIEFGLKSLLLQRRLQANLAYFNYNYKSMQVAKIVEQTAVNENADVKIQGVEAEFAIFPIANVQVDFNFAWLESEVKDFQSIDISDPAQSAETGASSTEGVEALFGSNCLDAIIFTNPSDPTETSPTPTATATRPFCSNPGVPQDVSGNALPYAPEFSIKVGIAYYQHPAWGGEIGYRLDYYWQNEFEAQIYNSNNDAIDSWSVTNLNFYYLSPSQNWRVGAFIKNLENEDHVTGHFVGDPTSGLFRNVFVLEPQLFGLSFSYTFN